MKLVMTLNQIEHILKLAKYISDHQKYMNLKEIQIKPEKY